MNDGHNGVNKPFNYLLYGKQGVNLMKLISFFVSSYSLVLLMSLFLPPHDFHQLCAPIINTRRIVADGIVTDSTNLVLLFYLAQLFLRELVKSYRLLQVVPMDMSSYYGESFHSIMCRWILNWIELKFLFSEWSFQKQEFYPMH